MPLTSTGFNALRTADFLTLLQNEFVELAGLPVGTEFTDDLLLSVFAGIAAGALGDVAQGPQAIYDGFSVNARNAQLDNVMGIVGVRRKRGNKSRVPVTLTGTSGQVLAAGIVIQGGGTNGTARWVSLAAVTLTGGTAVATFEAEEVGATTVVAGAASIVTPREGLTSAAFGSPVDLGTARETDDLLRVRGLVSTAPAGAHTIPAILSAVLAVEGVEDAFFIDNPDTTQQTVSGIALAARRHQLFVLPNPLSSAVQTNLLDAIAQNIPPGTITAATDVTRLEVHAPTGSSYLIGFDYGTELTVNVVATLTLEAGTALADALASLQELVTAFVANLRMGDGLTQIQLCTLAGQVAGVREATFTVNGVTSFTPNANQKIAIANVGSE